MTLPEVALVLTLSSFPTMSTTSPRGSRSYEPSGGSIGSPSVFQAWKPSMRLERRACLVEQFVNRPRVGSSDPNVSRTAHVKLVNTLLPEG
jgi:hypothetical protein